MAIQKRPYELSVWIEKLNGSHSKIEEKGVIIGAHDMSYPGKATNLVLKREIKGTNTLTFQMPDKYFDSLTGEYVRNEFIDAIFPECKLKLYYKNRWFEFFVKKVDEKKNFKSYMKTFTCSDAFIDELSRNGYGITYDTELYNNVEEIGTFTEETLDDSIWQYHPENNWGDFTEYKEEKLYRIPISQFGGTISAYKLKFNLTKNQMNTLKDSGKDTITNLFTDDERDAELSDDISRGLFWDQYTGEVETENPLQREYHTNIDNDGYIYVPYSCLSFCYGSEEEPDFSEKLHYDRAATETAIEVDGNLVLAPPSVDPRTIIQFYAIPKDAVIELDDAGVILNKDYTFFMTLDQWNHAISGNDWYMFEDTRLVEGEVLGSADVAAPTISHTFKYLKKNPDKVFNTDWESRGNKVVIYDGYLSDINGQGIIKGKKFSITNRTELNISKDIDQYVTVYNAKADDFADEYTNEDWTYSDESETTSGEKYRVCSKTATRQIIPQLARNLVQNGTDMDSTDGWSPMSYLLEDSIFISPAMCLRGVVKENEEDIYTSAIQYVPASVKLGLRWSISFGTNFSQEELDKVYFYYNNTKYAWGSGSDHIIGWCHLKSRIEHNIIDFLRTHDSMDIYCIGLSLYFKEEENVDGTNRIVYKYLWDKNDWIWQGLNRSKLFNITQTDEVVYVTPDENGQVAYNIEQTSYYYDDSQKGFYLTDGEYTDASAALVKVNNIITREGNISDNNGIDIVNFGIIGQEKKIEKDKVYCLGFSVYARKNFKIKIGKGSLISEGNYTLVGDNILEFEIGKGDGVISYDLYGGLKDPLKGQSNQEENITLSELPPKKYILFKAKADIENPYFVLESTEEIYLFKLYLFEAYTKGRDAFPAEESTYRYSGRDLFWQGGIKGNNYERTDVYTDEAIRKKIIFEDEVMLGSTYGYQQYFIQRLVATDKNKEKTYYDTMGHKSFISSDIKELQDAEHLPCDAAKYTEDDQEIQTNFIDLNKCPYYDHNAQLDECDCKHDGGHSCYFQKFGYCPFRFKTEKHDRRVRTLSVSKSNRFNIIQETSKVFEVYPQFYIDHKANGSVLKDEEGEYLKKVFFITDKGRENKIGFRYEKNLKDISRNVVSDQIVTKLYVLDVDSELSKTGLCSIKTAEDNPSKDSYIIDLSYYIEKGMLEKEEVEQDLYGVTPTKKDLTNQLNEIPSGFLYQLGYYNKQYDDLSNKIINLQDASFTELEANLTVNYQGIITAQEQVLKIKKQLDKYKSMYVAEKQYETQQAYLNYLAKLSEQQSILTQLIYTTFFTNGVCDDNAFVIDEEKTTDPDNPVYVSCFNDKKISALKNKIKQQEAISAIDFFDCITDLEESKKYWIDKRVYTKGILGQFNKEYMQIQQWKKERASYLKLINQISSAFYRKYEPYLKEGTWSDSNYLTDNAYYFGALDVAAEGAIPKVTYSISVIDLAPLSEEYDDIYDFDLADVTYVEDIGMFGIDKHTGLPNRLKTLISAFSEGLDDPSKDTITVQNFTTSFQDLFQQVTASVQSLTYNENIYKRSSNFTSLQNISNGSLQGALDTNELTLLDTEENNIKVDNTGTSGSDINNHANKYKLDGQGLFFSNDGGQHWSVGVGPSGINADYIKVGTLDAGKIRIADSSYVYFAWDKDGIVAYRDPQSINTDAKNINDAAVFNKYGLSIINNGVIKLRAGYSYNGNSTTPETSVGDDIGFYLYNSDGKVIFSTATSKSEDSETAKRETAELFLVGEMLVTNNYLVSVNNAETVFSEKITTTSQNYTILNSVTFAVGDGMSYSINGNTAIINNTNGKSIRDCIALILNKNRSIDIVEEGANKYQVNNKNYSSLRNMCLDGQFYVSDVTKISFTYGIINESGGIDAESEVNYYALQTSGDYNTIAYGTEGGNINADTITSSPSSMTISNDTSATIRISGLVEENTQPALHYNYAIKTEITTYSINGELYKSKTKNSSGGSASGDVALYLNNKKDVNSDSTSTESKPSRIFTACTSDGQHEVTNVFSILKNGDLYIGGRIVGQYSAAQLSDNIEIADAGIYITNGGDLRMDFANILGSDGTDLPTYITNQIKDESSTLSDLMSKMIQDSTAGMMIQGSNSISFTPTVAYGAGGIGRVNDYYKHESGEFHRQGGPVDFNYWKMYIKENQKDGTDGYISLQEFADAVISLIVMNGITINF